MTFDVPTVVEAMLGGHLYDPVSSLFQDQQQSLDVWGASDWWLDGHVDRPGDPLKAVAATVAAPPRNVTQPETPATKDETPVVHAGIPQAVHGLAEPGVTVAPPRSGSPIVDVALRFVGNPYVFGDEGEFVNGKRAFDCSGLVYWSLSHAGIDVGRMSAAGYQSTFKKVTRKQLRPGDLLFYWYPNSRGLPQGTASHVEIYVGNGKSVGADNPGEGVRVENVDWSAFVGGGRTGKGKVTAAGNAGKAGKPEAAAAQPLQRAVGSPSTAPVALSKGHPTRFSSVLGSLLAPEIQAAAAPKPSAAASPTAPAGSKGWIKSELYRGFMDAGRPDLAKMVFTKAFETWINAESGWNPGNVSGAYSGKVNGGLFQFRWFDDRKWLTPYFRYGNTPGSNGRNTFTASAYQQALFVARHFSLTPDDIRTYANAIRNGTYGGWA